MADGINTHGMTIGFGKHKDALYTRLPCGYLWWMVNNRSREYEVAMAELDRRGMKERPTMDISAHAVDNASLRCLDSWDWDHDHNEGLHSWVVRIAREALEDGNKFNDEKYVHRRTGLLLVFQLDLAWPVLVTMYPASKSKILEAKNG